MKKNLIAEKKKEMREVLGPEYIEEDEYANDPLAKTGGQGNVKLSGSAYKINQAGFNEKLWKIRVPREYWEIKRGDVSFKTFSQKPYWRSTKTPFIYQSSKQLAVYEQLLDLIEDDSKGEEKLHWYNGRSIVISSNPTNHMATCAAAHLVTEMMRCRESPKIKWVDAVELSPWGRPAIPDAKMAPDITIITGLHPDPTKETRD